ncbi:hypothetical protein ACQ4PT_051101 [Festuca glaucescens]
MSPPSPSLLLLHRHVRTDLPDDSIEHKVVPLSSSKGVQAIGFDEAVDPMVLGLVLEAHLAVAPDLSFLALRGGIPFTSINTVDKNLIVISSTFTESHYREIFLVFNAIDSSLRVIPAVPRDLHLNRTSRLLAVRHHDDNDDIGASSSYSLVISGSVVTSISDQGFAEWHDVLFIYSPASLTTTWPWQAKKKANFPKQPQLVDTFFADEAFLFRGRGYWADLLCSVMHCDCRDVLSDDSVHPVEFSFLNLPGPRLTNPHGREAVAELGCTDTSKM